MMQEDAQKAGGAPAPQDRSAANGARNRDLTYAGACAALAVASVLLTLPVLEMGLNDDWSYAYTAQVLAKTGHLVFNNFATAMVGAQAYWGAFWIKVFGFSFTMLRLSMLPFDAGCAMLLYALGRHAGLTPAFSALQTLTVVLSPVYLPEAASFMTDICGFFFMLLALYSCVRAAEAQEKHCSARQWLLLVLFAGLLGGTVRQVVWLVPLGCLPYLAWLWRQDKGFSRTVLGFWGFTLVGVAASTLWFHFQPYAVLERPWAGLKALLDGLPGSLWPTAALGLTALLLVLPLLVEVWPAWRVSTRVGPRTRVTLLLLLGFLGLLAFYHPQSLLAPWSVNIIGIHGVIGQNVLFIGNQPVTLPGLARVLLSVMVFVAAGRAAVSAAQGRDARQQEGSHPREMQPIPLTVRFFVVFIFLYVPLLALRSNAGGAFDRYLILAMPALGIPLLLHYQKKVRGSISPASWSVLAVFTFYGIATTHDYMAAARARLAGATRLTAAGVPRTEIMAGIEYDGWTQIEQEHRIGGTRTGIPYPLQYHPGPGYPIAQGYNGAGMTPSISFNYFVVMSPQPELVNPGNGPADTVPYTAWLPPFHRQVFIQQMPAEAARSSGV